MATVQAVRVGAAPGGVDEDFVQLVCADEQLLRAEFDAIIDREWPARHPPAQPAAGPPTTGPDPKNAWSSSATP